MIESGIVDPAKVTRSAIQNAASVAAMVLSAAFSVFRRREHVHFFNRRIDDATVKNALAVLGMYLLLFLSGGFTISQLEGLSLGDCLFESASALA